VERPRADRRNAIIAMHCEASSCVRYPHRPASGAACIAWKTTTEILGGGAGSSTPLASAWDHVREKNCPMRDGTFSRTPNRAPASSHVVVRALHATFHAIQQFRAIRAIHEPTANGHHPVMLADLR